MRLQQLPGMVLAAAKPSVKSFTFRGSEVPPSSGEDQFEKTPPAWQAKLSPTVLKGYQERLAKKKPYQQVGMTTTVQLAQPLTEATKATLQAAGVEFARTPKLGETAVLGRMWLTEVPKVAELADVTQLGGQQLGVLGETTFNVRTSLKDLPDWMQKIDTRLLSHWEDYDETKQDKDISLHVELSSRGGGIAALKQAGFPVNHIVGNMATAHMKLSQLQGLAEREEVSYLQGSVQLRPTGGLPPVFFGAAVPDEAEDNPWRQKLDAPLASAHCQYEQTKQEQQVALFVRLSDDGKATAEQALRDAGLQFSQMRGKILTGQIQLSQLKDLAKLEQVKSLQLSQQLRPLFS